MTELQQARLKVLDLSLYQEVENKFRTTIVTEDVAGLVIEAGDRPLHERINPRRLKTDGADVIDPKTGRSVGEEFSKGNAFARRETKGAMRFYSKLVAEPEGTLVFTFSPAGGPYDYIESRINVGVRKGENIDFYGIPSHLKPEGLLAYATRASEWSGDKFDVSEPEKLRERALSVSVPENVNPWVFLAKALPLDSKAWQAIFEGLPWKVKAMAEKDAAWVAKEMSFKLSTATTEHERIAIGAWGEQMMESMGWKLNTSACPGLFNSQLIEAASASSGPFATTDSFGNLRLTGPLSSESGKYINNCGNCKKHLGMYMKAGDHCPHCNGEYKGC